MPKSATERKSSEVTSLAVSRHSSFTQGQGKTDKNAGRPPIRLRGGHATPPPPLTSKNIVDHLPPISSGPVSRRDSFTGTHVYGATASGMGTPRSTHTSYASQGTGEKQSAANFHGADPAMPPSPSAQPSEYLRASCLKVYFPNVNETVHFTPEEVATFNSTVRSNNTPLMSPTSTAAASFYDGSNQSLPTSFTASDVENVIQLRAALGTSAGLLSSTITAGKDYPLSLPSSRTPTDDVGVLPRNAPNHLLCGHPLVIYKVRSSAAAAISCFPRFGMLQRHPGDTINYFSASELMAEGVGDSLTAVERASERLCVTVKHHDDESAPTATRSRSPARPITTREIEFLRLDYIAVLDTPTQVSIKNTLREKLEGTPKKPEHSNSRGATASLKALQPTLAKIFDDLKNYIPQSHADGSNNHSSDLIHKENTVAPNPALYAGCYAKEGYVDITCYMDCGEELAGFIPKRQGGKFAFWTGIAEEEESGAALQHRLGDGPNKAPLTKIQHPLPIHQNAFIRLRYRPSHEGSIASGGQAGANQSASPHLTATNNTIKLSPIASPQVGSPKSPQNAKTATPIRPTTVVKATKGGIFSPKVPLGVVVLLVILLYSFVYSWRHCTAV